MMDRTQTFKLFTLFIIISSIIFGMFAKANHEYNVSSEKYMSSVWLKKLFKGSKLVCFGRYAMEIPEAAEIIIGSVSAPSDIEIFPASSGEMKRLISQELEKIKNDHETAEVIYSGIGPLPNSWQIRYFADKYKKARNAIFFSTFVTKNNLIFAIGDATSSGETESSVIQRQADLSRRLRMLGESEIPTEPGFCAGKGFVAESNFSQQEMVNAGIDFFEYPDVTFSISSNKNAYGDLNPLEFEKTSRKELSLLARIQQAKDIQGDDYPFRVVLREGKRTVQHWHGEESLFRREDGTHDFEWAFVGTPKDVANPSEYRIKMFTKVADNTVGAAEKASLTDEEAVALWDRLLSGLKFRVKVPGAPVGSYYFLPGEKTTAGAKP